MEDSGDISKMEIRVLNPSPITCYRCHEPVTPRGECRCEDGICLIHADCRDVLPLLEAGSVDLVLTDPPYGIGADKNRRANTQHGKAISASRDYGIGNLDSRPLTNQECDALLRFGRAIIWGGNYQPLPPSSCWFVWDKQTGNNGYADAELAWTNLGGAVRLFRWQWKGMFQQRTGPDKEARFHPTQKPTDLMIWCLERAKSEGSVLDPFAGSGTTGRACKDLGRRAILIEIEEEYCDIAARRLEQGVLFT